MKKLTPKRPAATTVSNGAKDLRELAYQSEPEWSVYAVEASLAKVAEQLARLLKGSTVSDDILSGPLTCKGHDIRKITPLVSVQDSPWTVAYRTVGYYMSAEAVAADKHAQALSKRLKTRALSYHREAISGATTCRMFENGNDLGEGATEEDVADDKTIDMIFRTMDLYIPACLLYPEDDKIVFEVKPVSAKMVGQAWLVEGR